MVAFLFWNINNKNLQKIIGRLVSVYKVDVLLLAECNNIDPTILLCELNQKEPDFFNVSTNRNYKRIQIFTRFSADFFSNDFAIENEKITIRNLKLPGRKEILLAVIHFLSKVRHGIESQTAIVRDYAELIRKNEEENGHSRTILVGDLNMNPFEPGMYMAQDLHGVMCQKIAKRGSRIVQNKPYPFFYNPMWNLFGDKTPGTPGTYFLDKSGISDNLFWHMYDQVLIRPDLIDEFIYEELKIITSVENESLLNDRGLPDKENLSDHLPIYFKLKLKMED